MDIVDGDRGCARKKRHMIKEHGTAWINKRFRMTDSDSGGTANNLFAHGVGSNELNNNPSKHGNVRA